MTAKEQTLQVLSNLPDDCTLEQIRYELYAIDHIERGLADVDASRGMSHEEVGTRFRGKLAFVARLLPGDEHDS